MRKSVLALSTGTCSGSMAATSLTQAADHKYPGFSYEEEGQWKGPYCFIQSSDTQFGLIDSWNEVAEDDQKWDQEMLNTKQAIQAANAMSPKPRFFIVCGDMVNAFPWEKYNDPQVKDFRDVFKELDPSIPLVCVCGNHDVGDTPTQESLQKYRSNFGDDFFTFWVGGVFFIVINSQFYKDASNVIDKKDEHDKWLDEQLTFAKSSCAKHVVLFQHIPWFLNKPDEDDDYFNISKEVRLGMLKKIKDAGIKYIFAGHYHQNAGGFDEDLEMVVTSAVGLQIKNDKDSGLRIVRVLSDHIHHEYHELRSIPGKVSL